MARIYYLLLTFGGLAGGHKMTVRHVEALRDLGFDACLLTSPESAMPTWFDHRAPVVVGPAGVQKDDVLVIADDAHKALQLSIRRREQTVVLAQNAYHLSVKGAPALDQYPPDRFPAVIAISPRLGTTVQRLYPQAQVEIVRCFADDRLFRPDAVKTPEIAYMPRKRMFEADSIAAFFRKYHPGHADLAWTRLHQVNEATVAQALNRSGLHLSLSRLEGAGMSTLEAMASGCVVAGFTGIGGVEYANWENGFWAPEDDCEAAADALASASDVFLTGGPMLRRRQEAALATARLWSFERFSADLEEVWMRLAPRARIRNGPLD
jgi:glycosyltransferase involved in cell wall biosynthesis